MIYQIAFILLDSILCNDWALSFSLGMPDLPLTLTHIIDVYLYAYTIETWMHPNSKQWHLIDYVIVRRKDRVTKTICGADCWTDHRLVVSKLNLRIQPVRRPQGGAKEIRCLQAETRQQEASIRQRSLQPFRCTGTQFRRWRWELDSLQRHRSLFSNGFPRTSISQTPRLVWWEWQKIQGLLEEKHQNHKAYLRNTSSVSSKTAYSNICKTVQTRLRDMQDSWLRKKADEIQSFAGRKDMKKFFDALKTVYGPQSLGTTPLLSADGTSLLTDKEAIFKRWAEYFDGVLNRPSSINDEAINRLPLVECNPLLDELPTVSETVKAIKLVSSGKVPGSDAIPAEIYTAGGPPVAEKLTELFHIMWRKEAIPQGCNNHPPFQKERESSCLWQSSRHLFIVNCWEDSC